MRRCEVLGCEKKVLARDLCSMHYQRLLTKGDIGPAKAHDGRGGSIMKKLRIRFRVNGCIEVVSHRPYRGYPSGRIPPEKKQKAWHLIAWERQKGPRPDGHHIHHVCENKLCINVAHLESMPAGEHTSMHMKTVWERSRA